MSQRDHGLMEPVTAAEAFSVPVSPPPRDSMEDADPSLTRKRPRLDSGSKDTLAMPTDSAPLNTTAAPPREQQVEMTIRSQPPTSSQALDGVDDTEHVPVAAAPADEDIDLEAAAFSTDIAPALGDDDPADSPPVIAIDDDDSDNMIGFAVPSAAQLDYDAEVYFQRFPFTQHGNYLQAVHSIAQHFQGSK
jgi:ubiquitin carboxyl-terminal hydrolase 34